MKKIFAVFLSLFFVCPVFAEDVALKNVMMVNRLEEIDWTPFMNDMEAKIKQNWQVPPETNKSKGTTLIFKVNKNGELISVSLMRSSGVVENDEAAIAAVKAAAPFRKLPDEYKKSFLTLDFTFDYSILGNDNQYVAQNTVQKKEPFQSPVIKQKNYVLKNDTYATTDEYIYNARRKIIKNWKPINHLAYEEAKKANNIFAEVIVNSRGELLDYRILRSSDFKKAEQNALMAIEHSAPFAAFPENIKQNVLKFNVSFIY